EVDQKIISLPAHLLDYLAKWVRLDGTVGIPMGKAWEVQDQERMRIADVIALKLLEVVEKECVNGELARALADRESAYKNKTQWPCLADPAVEYGEEGGSELRVLDRKTGTVLPG
ncbi:hypothetical protein V2K54_25490, partial [Pseudomonas alliivorans]|nr:hypothetical protein [Pseudomonas alliivorans]